MAKELLVPENGLTQSTVRFKDSLVDFISSTPEPPLDSEEETGTSENTPRSDASEHQSDRSDLAPVLTEAGSSTLMKNEMSAESDQPEQLLPVANGSQHPRNSQSVFPSEIELTESDQKLMSVEDKNKHTGKKSAETNAQPDAKSSQANTGSRHADCDIDTGKPDAETTNKIDSSTSKKSTEKNSSNRKHAVGSTRVLGSWGKSSGSLKPKPTEPAVRGSKTAEPYKTTAASKSDNVAEETTVKASRSSSNKPTEKRLSDRKDNTPDRDAGSSIKSAESSTTKSAEVQDSGSVGRNKVIIHCVQKKHALLFSCITLRKSNQFE